MQMSYVKVNVVVGNGIGVVLPQVRLFGSNILFSRWKALSLYATASFPACIQNTSTLPMSYSWKVYDGTTYLPSIISTSASQRYFKVDPYTLDAAKTYTISVYVSLGTGGVASKSLGYASGKIQVGTSGVTALIAGGTPKVFSTADVIILDASASADNDYPAAILTYIWSCQQYQPIFGIACSGFSAATPSKLLMPAGRLAAGSTYNLSVAVTNAAGVQNVASVLVQISASPVPGVAINAPKVKYNTEEKIILTGQVSSLLGESVASPPPVLRYASPQVYPSRMRSEPGVNRWGEPLVYNTLCNWLYTNRRLERPRQCDQGELRSKEGACYIVRFCY
jgi:hypothetical protein